MTKTNTPAATAALILCVASAISAQTNVRATVETAPVPSSGDAADDICVWVHPTTPNLSLVIGTDKLSGIGVYSMSGTQLQFLSDGDMNNVDLRYGFPLGSTSVALVTAGERGNNVIAVYAVDPVQRRLYDVSAQPIALSFAVYGSCMYHSQVTGDYYVIVNSESGYVEQWRLFHNGNGRVAATRVRTFNVGSQTEGCVADDENARLFIGEENVGIWRYGAEPGAGTSRVQVDTTGSGGRLVADVEGLAIYYTAGGGGLLLAVSQGNNRFVAYDRNPPHAFRMTFQIVANSALGIDAVSDTDGIEVVNLPLGSAFPSGAFLAQDGLNSGGNQNYKLVPWQAIANSVSPPLPIDSTYDALGAFGRTATATAFGAGCGSPALGFVPDTNNPPVLGQTARATVRNVPSSFAAVAWGWIPLTPPLSLAGIGMPGCDLLEFPEVLGLGTSQLTSSTRRFSLAIPNQPGLMGLRAYIQAYAFAPGANPMQLIISNGIRWSFGN